jgi:lipopolysaccharide transport system permease protein
MAKMKPVVEITSTPPLLPDFAESWRYRWMALALARRNIVTRYTQTMLGPGWFIIQPIMLTGILALVMGAILGAPSDGMPYLLFCGTGAVLWTTFNRSIIEIAMSLVATGGIFGKVYFPRLLVPVAALLTAAVDFGPVYALLIVAVVGYGMFPGWPFLLFPAFVLLTLMLAFALGLWLTVFDAYYRDVRLTLPFVLQFVFYLSPVMYAASAIPATFRIAFSLNPLTGLLNGFRWSLVAGAPPPTLFEVTWVLGLALIALLGGLIVFARFERIVVDRI